MTTMPTATLDIATVDPQGRPAPVFHGALRSLADAFREVGRFTPAPVNPAVRKRIQTAGAGRFSIGQFDVSISVLDLSPSVLCTFNPRRCRVFVGVVCLTDSGLLHV